MMTNPVFKKFAMVFMSLVMFSMMLMTVGCDTENNSVNSVTENPTESIFQLDVAKVISLLSSSQVSKDEQKYLNNLSDSDWDLISRKIEKRGMKFIPDGCADDKERDTKNQSTLASCTWDGTTRWNSGLTKSRGYKYQGHNAIYFTVDANASCYSKNADWWVYTWTPTHGSVHSWYLLLDRDRYWNGNKWVKDVVLLVPTTWWSVYYPHWPSSFKAGRFNIRWYHQNNGCCE